MIVIYLLNGPRLKSPTHLFMLALKVSSSRVLWSSELRHGRRTRRLTEAFVVLRIRYILLRWFKRRFRRPRSRSQSFLPPFHRFSFYLLFPFLQIPNSVSSTDSSSLRKRKRKPQEPPPLNERELIALQRHQVTVVLIGLNYQFCSRLF